MLYRSSISITSVAASRALLEDSEVMEAIGIDDTVEGETTSANITAIGLQISDLIAYDCNVPRDGVREPTFLQETITETFRRTNVADRSWPYMSSEKNPAILDLARRPVSSVTSVTVDGSLLAAANYDLNKEEGALLRLVGDSEATWASGKIVVVYVAGYSTAPPLLKLAAKEVLREQWARRSRDPLLKSETVEGIGKFDFWVNGGSSGVADRSVISSGTRAMLKDFRYPAL